MLFAAEKNKLYNIMLLEKVITLCLYPQFVYTVSQRRFEKLSLRTLKKVFFFEKTAKAGMCSSSPFLSLPQASISGYSNDRIMWRNKILCGENRITGY